MSISEVSFAFSKPSGGGKTCTTVLTEWILFCLLPYVADTLADTPSPLSPSQQTNKPSVSVRITLRVTIAAVKQD